MKRTYLSLSAVFAATILAACQTTKEAPNAASIGVDFSWQGVTKCSSKSPAFKLTGVPAETKTLNFRMTDLDVPSYQHGGGSLAYTGQGEIPAGAFSYVGPCPPMGSHDYKFDVMALDAKGDTIIGKGSATRAFPPK
ncbi:YbhB/YbcL family Raf kinase inhibitor-like protein [Shumkonia mesophila]|uniref:YbhB/YbcL family Raf kinase inhibitor-like protein n=1 Tax=Shumkonia mesophila TaxID=2838854 RepID=UPI0029349C72|nr:YbhB/YbcL family Raf kinase inhibitor-like protein [Shumkonia mesophila]